MTLSQTTVKKQHVAAREAGKQASSAAALTPPSTEDSRTSLRRKPSRWQQFARQWDIQLMIWPGIVLVFIFAYLPMYGVLMGFQDYNLFQGFWASEWVGFKHFNAFFSSPDFMAIMRNTLMISLLRLLIIFPAPIILALLLNEVRNALFKRTIQTVSYLPYFLSWVVVAQFVRSLLAVDGGTLNGMLESLNWISAPINWLSIPEYFWGILVTTNLWKSIGFASIVYLAAIAGIDPALYESASIDGASRFKQMYLITVPCIMPVVLIFLILEIGNFLTARFEDILLLQSPMVREYADVIDTYVYRYGIQNGRYAYATAVGLFKAIVSVGLLVGANALARRAGHSLW